MMRFFHFALLFVFIALPVSAQESKKPLLNIETVISPGGITAWLVQDHSVPVISINFGFRDAGSVHDPLNQQGLAQMLSNTLDEGAGDMDSPTFQKALRDYSVQLSFGSDRDYFSGNLVSLTRYQDKAYELLNLALTKPRFDEDAVNRMRAANQSRIRSSLSDPDWMAARIMNDRAFDGHVYSQNSGGTLSNLDNIKSEDLQAFQQSRLGKNNLVVAVAGDITPDQLAAALDKMFAGLPESIETTMPPYLNLQNQGKIYVYETPIPQTIISVLQPGIKRTDPDYQTAQIMNFILGSSGFGSRLMDQIREKRGLTYGIYSSFINMDHFDGLSVSTSTDNKNAGEILKLTKAEWDGMKAAPVSAKEIKDAKTYLIGALPLSLTSTNQISSFLLSLQLDRLPIDYLEQRERAIEAATQDDVLRVAQKILNKDHMITVLVGKPEGIENAEKITELPDVK